MLEEQLTSPHSLSTRVERKSRYDRERDDTRASSGGTRKTTDSREISLGGGIQRKTVWGGGSTTEKDGPKESIGGEGGGGPWIRRWWGWSTAAERARLDKDAARGAKVVGSEREEVGRPSKRRGKL